MERNLKCLEINFLGTEIMHANKYSEWWVLFCSFSFFFFTADVDEQENEKITSSKKDAYSMFKKVQETV